MSIRVVFGVVVLSLATLSASAQDGVLRFGAQGVLPTEDARQTVSWSRGIEGVGRLNTTPDVRVDVDNGSGFAVGYEYKFNPRVGMDLNLSYTQNDFLIEGQGEALLFTGTGPIQQGSVQFFQSGELAMIPLTLGANVHFFPERPIDLYVGGFVGFVFFEDLDLDAERVNLEFPPPVPSTILGEAEKIPVESDATYGAVIGVDLPLGASAWVFNASARYSRISATVRDEDGEYTLDVHPVTLQLGVGYVF